jgi:O-antigen ligase
LDFIKKHPIIFLLSLLYLGVMSLLIFFNNYYIAALPLGLIVIYIALFYQSQTFLLIAFLTPLSVNLEEFTDGKIGLFLPTEPILFGLMLLTIFHQIRFNYLPKHIWKHPIIVATGFYVLWVFITSISSTHVDVSFKFLLMKIWYIVPVLLFGTYVFMDKKNIKRFLWLFAVSMTFAIVYTLIRHWGYNFGEKEGHWVMSPLFKDHTIYGAIVAINLFILLGLYLSKKHDPLTQITLLILLLITLAGLYFSYTRGAWLSVVVALSVWLFIHYKVKFKYLLILGISGLLILFISWDKIQMELARNSAEHTTEQFDERLRSAANVTSDASNLERLNRWTAAWEMFKERPIFGFGPATYAFEYAPYQDPKKLTIISTNFGNMGNAHSEYLGPLAEMGILGFVSMLLIVIAIFYTGITLYIRYPKEEKEMRTLLLFMILALVTYFFHGILNNYLDTDKAAVPVYAMCAAIIALGNYYPAPSTSLGLRGTVIPK